MTAVDTSAPRLILLGNFITCLKLPLSVRLDLLSNTNSSQHCAKVTFLFKPPQLFSALFIRFGRLYCQYCWKEYLKVQLLKVIYPHAFSLQEVYFHDKWDCWRKKVNFTTRFDRISREMFPQAFSVKCKPYFRGLSNSFLRCWCLLLLNLNIKSWNNIRMRILFLFLRFLS